jgi:uncharacterized membrane protein YdjX (TVP38/TMEM64 family)
VRKKTSIFKILVEYLRTHPVAVLGWIWVSLVPLLGSLVLASQYFWVEKIHLESPWDHLILSLGITVVLGLALLPTTLTALACGFFLGWIGFPDLLLGYVFANGIGFAVGKKLNSDFLTILYARNPELKEIIESRIERPQGLIFFIRISPVIPFALSNFLFASMGIPLRKVLLFGVPGMLPRTFVAFATGMLANSFLGAKESLNHPLQWIILIVLLILSLVGIYLNWKKTKA